MPRTRFSAFESSVSRSSSGLVSTKFDGADRVGDLFDIERGLRPRVLVDFARRVTMPLGPLHAEQIELLEEIEELVLRPFRIGEALVLRIGRDRRRRLFAGHAFGRDRPQIEKGAAEAGLQLQRAFGVGQPVFENLADGLDHVGDVVGHFAFDLAFLARLQIGGERLAAFLDQAGDIVRERLDLDRADLRLFLGRFLDRFFGRRGATLFHRC